MLEKWADFSFPLNVKKPKMLYLQGDFPSDPLTIRSSTFQSNWELRAQTPITVFIIVCSCVPPLKFYGLQLALW